MAKKQSKPVTPETEARCFSGVLYPDSENYNCEEKLAKIASYFNQFAYALHDNDFNEDLSPKKPHYHWAGRFDNPRRCRTICEDLGIEFHDLEVVRRWKRMLRYLIHLDDKDKAKYEASIIVCNFDISKFLESTDEGAAVMQLVDAAITDSLNLYQLACYANGNNLWSVYRRNYSIIKNMLELPRHNPEVIYVPEYKPDYTDME